MTYEWADRLLFAVFLLISVALGIFAALFELPRTYAVVAIVITAVFYIYIQFKHIEQLDKRISKEAFTLTDREIVHSDGSGRTTTLRWDRLKRIGFARCEAFFPDPWLGDYDEEYWFVVGANDALIEVSSELKGVKELVRQFKRRFPDFKDELADRAVRSREHGHWICWRNPKNDLTTQSR